MINHLKLRKLILQGIEACPRVLSLRRWGLGSLSWCFRRCWLRASRLQSLSLNFGGPLLIDVPLTFQVLPLVKLLQRLVKGTHGRSLAAVIGVDSARKWAVFIRRRDWHERSSWRTGNWTRSVGVAVHDAVDNGPVVRNGGRGWTRWPESVAVAFIEI